MCVAEVIRFASGCRLGYMHRFSQFLLPATNFQNFLSNKLWMTETLTITSNLFRSLYWFCERKTRLFFLIAWRLSHVNLYIFSISHIHILVFCNYSLSKRIWLLIGGLSLIDSCRSAYAAEAVCFSVNWAMRLLRRQIGRLLAQSGCHRTQTVRLSGGNRFQFWYG